MTNRALIAAGCAVALLSVALLDACARTEAQQTEAQKPVPAAPHACKATVTPLGNTKGCPVAPVRFHVSIDDCAQSGGTFKYHYLYVTAGNKETLERSATWIGRKKAWDQTDQVPAACDAEIDDVEVDEVSGCTCAGR
jgi:hypothetical protein